MRHTPQQLLSYLDQQGISYQFYEHPPVFTVDEAKQHCSHIPGAHCKNLFLRTKKRAYWLVVLLNEAQAHLDDLGAELGAGRFSFASAERLDDILGVIPGAVTPLALVNDSKRQVQIALDKRLLDYAVVTFHPLVNNVTIALAPADLLRFLESLGYRLHLLELSFQ